MILVTDDKNQFVMTGETEGESFRNGGLREDFRRVWWQVKITKEKERPAGSFYITFTISNLLSLKERAQDILFVKM